MKKKPISTGSDWTFELLDKYYVEIERIAHDVFQLDTYPNQIEVITAEQMMDAYASVGMPVGYSHWSFGKQFIQTEQNYKRGAMGLAYEIVINSNPCISYLMEENTMTMQALVIAHAAFGHNSFFKNNYLFKTWTDADSIIDYLVFAKDYVKKCEMRYGIDEVEDMLDSCHALMNHGVDRYKHPPPISIEEEQRRQQSRQDYIQSQINDIWRTLPDSAVQKRSHSSQSFPTEPQENLLYFFEKNAPLLKPWQREIIRIVRKIAQYFYPQRQTKVMNEGWATFWHYTILNQMHKEELVTDGFMMEFLQSHTNVVYQPTYDKPYYNGVNPYALGFAMMSDIRRICESPTDEDRQWFPDIAGSPWRKTLESAMIQFKDESYIAQYLSPKLIRDFKFFTILDDSDRSNLEVSAIHNEHGYKAIRQQLSDNFNLSINEPNIEVVNVDINGDRSLKLRHKVQDGRMLDDGSANEVLRHVYRLWRFPVHLESVNLEDKVLRTYYCPENPH
jgi:stage V sporulation protein R